MRAADVTEWWVGLKGGGGLHTFKRDRREDPQSESVPSPGFSCWGNWAGGGDEVVPETGGGRREAGGREGPARDCPAFKVELLSNYTTGIRQEHSPGTGSIEHINPWSKIQPDAPETWPEESLQQKKKESGKPHLDLFWSLYGGSFTPSAGKAKWYFTESYILKSQ